MIGYRIGDMCKYTIIAEINGLQQQQQFHATPSFFTIYQPHVFRGINVSQVHMTFQPSWPEQETVKNGNTVEIANETSTEH